MEEKNLQNIDIPQDNPLKTGEEKILNKTKKNLSPKIILLISLIAIIFVLSLLAIIVSGIRKNSSRSLEVSPTPTSFPINPTTTDSLIPSPYQSAFKEIEQKFSQDLDLPVPQIDPEIGL